MRRLSGDPINASDISEYCKCESDFAFELQTLALLNKIGVNCEHGGVYEDPVTQKARQFDIRGLLRVNQINRVRIAVECKNVRPNFPLVVFTVPRSDEESYHEFISSCERPRGELFIPNIYASNAKCIRQEMDASIYRSTEPVGKSCCQVGRDQNGAFRSSDSEAYDKWWQAIQSAHDLVDIAGNDWELSRQKMSNTLILPVLVVPNGRLWAVHYRNDGTVVGAPAPENRASLYVDKFVPSSNRLSGVGASISHIEVVTCDGLKDLLGKFSGKPEGVDPFAGY